MDERLFRLDGRAGLVVGAGSGIGRAIALAFGSAGAIVGCVDMAEENAKATIEYHPPSTAKTAGGNAAISQASGEAGNSAAKMLP